MFNVRIDSIEKILKDYNIDSKIIRISELQRVDSENSHSALEKVRLIMKVELEKLPSLVIRFENGLDAAARRIEDQSLFANILRNNGIITPRRYKARGRFAKPYGIGGYDVTVTVEQFAENEIKAVDTCIAKKTGALLAKMHLVSEKKNLHIADKVLFDPFGYNELFDFEAFMSLEAAFDNEEKTLFDKIVKKYNAYMQILSPLKNSPRYAVQGDISNCNLYLTRSGEVGIFDFNRCGDNILFCDAVMQAVFEARLMDYPEIKEDHFETKILTAFLEGYCSVRSFSKEQQYWYPYLYAIINAFWSADIRWNNDSLLNAYKSGDIESVRRWLLTIWQRLTTFS